jgi:hypothetical protein
MKNHISRKRFLGSSVMAAAGLTILPSAVLGRHRVAPNDKLSIGFIGTGRISRGLANNFLNMENVDVVAASDVYKAKLDGFEAFVTDHYIEKSGKIILTQSLYVHLITGMPKRPLILLIQENTSIVKNHSPTPFLRAVKWLRPWRETE